MDMSEFFKKGKEYLETTKKRIEDLKSKVLKSFSKTLLKNDF